MDKYEFIKQLENALSGLSDEEIKAAVNYYKELFEDAGNENVQELINSLESPQQIAENIKRESGILTTPPKPADSPSEKPKTESRRDTLTILSLIILALLLSPVWLPLLIVAFILVAIPLLIVLIIAFVFGIIGITCIAVGLSVLFAFFPAGLAILGTGLLFTALTLICTPYLVKGTFCLCRTLINGTVQMFHGIFYKKGAAV